MSDRRARGLAMFLCMLVLAGGTWLLLEEDTSPEDSTAQLAAAPVPASPPAISPEQMPAPFQDRMIRRPDAMEPAPSQTAAFCSDENWRRIDVLVSRSDTGEFRVDAARWSRSLTSTQAGIASWMFQCKGEGQPVRIVADDTGVLLATYDPRSGLHALDR